MMPGSPRIRLSGDWKKLEQALSKGGTVVRQHIKRATAFIGKKGEALIRQEITSGEFESNKPLTVALKGGKNEPLKGDSPGAPLFKAITSQIIDDFTVFIGVLQTNGIYNIAVAIHYGVGIKITDKMRWLFYVLWLKSQDPSIELTDRAAELWEKMPGGWKPLKKSTTAIIIPSRPFVKNVMDSGKLYDIATKFWNEALAAAFKEIGQK
jgi:hypothetical protein